MNKHNFKHNRQFYGKSGKNGRDFGTAQLFGIERFSMVPEVGIEPTRTQGPLDFESSASTSFTTPAFMEFETIAKVSRSCQYDS